MMAYMHLQLSFCVIFQHWAQRMFPSAKDKGVKGENISTVGVDIGDLVMQRGGRKVIFRTWDFGGQVGILLYLGSDFHIFKPAYLM